MKILPPRMRNWKPGNVQLGLFIRTEAGIVVECTMDHADEAQRDAAYALLKAFGAKDAKAWGKRNAKNAKKTKAKP